MGTYIYKITGTKALPAVTSGEVSTYKFAYKYMHLDNAERARQERSERRLIESWGDKPFPRLLATSDRRNKYGHFQYGQLSVWASNSVIDAECVFDLGHAVDELPKREVFALESWVLAAIDDVRNGLLDFVPSNRKHVAKLTEYRMLSNELERRRAAGQSGLRNVWSFPSVDEALAYGKAAINW